MVFRLCEENTKNNLSNRKQKYKKIYTAAIKTTCHSLRLSKTKRNLGGQDFARGVVSKAISGFRPM